MRARPLLDDQRDTVIAFQAIRKQHQVEGDAVERVARVTPRRPTQVDASVWSLEIAVESIDMPDAPDEVEQELL